MTTHSTLQLASALDDPDPLVSNEAARLIGQWEVASLVPNLMRHIRNSRAYTKIAAIHSIGQIQGDGVESCLEAVFWQPNVPDDFFWYGFRTVRSAAAIELSRMGSTVADEWLAERWKQGDPVLTRWLAPTLLRLPEDNWLRRSITASALCARHLRDAGDLPYYTDPAMVCLLCEALGLIADAESREHLEFYLGFHSRFVRYQAALALQSLPKHPESIVRVLESASRFGTETDQIGAALARGDGDTLMRFFSTAALETDRVAAMTACLSIQPSSALDVCRQAIADPSAFVRRSGWEALGKFAPWGALDPDPGESDRLVLCTIEAIGFQQNKAVC